MSDDYRHVARLMGRYADSERVRASYQLTQAADEIDRLQATIAALLATIAALLAIPDEWAAENRSLAANRLRARMAAVVEQPPHVCDVWCHTSDGCVVARMAAVVEGEQ